MICNVQGQRCGDVVTVVLTTERFAILPSDFTGVTVPKPLSMFAGLKFVMKSRPYVYLTMFFLFSWLGTQVR